MMDQKSLKIVIAGLFLTFLLFSVISQAEKTPILTAVPFNKDFNSELFLTKANDWIREFQLVPNLDASKYVSKDFRDRKDAEEIPVILNSYFYNLLAQAPSQMHDKLREIYFGNNTSSKRISTVKDYSLKDNSAEYAEVNINQINITSGELYIEESQVALSMPMVKKYFRLKAAFKAYIFLQWQELFPSHDINNHYHYLNAFAELFFLNAAISINHSISAQTNIFLNELSENDSLLHNGSEIHRHFNYLDWYSSEQIPMIAIDESFNQITTAVKVLERINIEMKSKKPLQDAVGVERLVMNIYMENLQLINNLKELKMLQERELTMGDEIMHKAINLRIQSLEGTSPEQISGNVVSFLGGCEKALK